MTKVTCLKFKQKGNTEGSAARGSKQSYSMGEFEGGEIWAGTKLQVTGTAHGE